MAESGIGILITGGLFVVVLIIAIIYINVNKNALKADGKPGTMWFTRDVSQTVRYSTFYFISIFALMLGVVVALPYEISGLIFFVLAFGIGLIDIALAIFGLFVLLVGGGFPELINFEFAMDIAETVASWMFEMWEIIVDLHLYFLAPLIVSIFAGYFLGQYIEQKRTGYIVITAFTSLVSLSLAGFFASMFTAVTFSGSSLSGGFDIPGDIGFLVLSLITPIPFSILGLEIAERVKEGRENVHLPEIRPVFRKFFAIVGFASAIAIIGLIGTLAVIAFETFAIDFADTSLLTEQILAVLSLVIAVGYVIYFSVQLFGYGLKGDLNYEVRFGYLEDDE